MKALYLIAMICSVVIFSNCNQDQDLAEATDGGLNEASAWKPSDGMSPYLSAETRAQMPAEDLEFVDRILRNPNEDILRSRGAEVHIPAGSVDALQDAIDAANPGDVIVLEAGDHMESGPIVIGKTVSLIGEKSSNLIFSNIPSTNGLSFNAAIQINETGSGSMIKKINFKTGDPIGGTTIFVNQASTVKILQNHFENWQVALFGHKATRMIVTQNIMNASTAWQTGAIPESHGILLSDGVNNQLVLNTITGGLDGIFTGGMKGIDFSNSTSGCYIGQILCHVPSDAYSVNGVLIAVDAPTNNWWLKYNKADYNLGIGFLIIDGSFSNFLYGNSALGNGIYDIELAGDSYRFGFLTPRCVNNTVFALKNQVVKDCGENNHVYGGKRVNTYLDPCN